MHHKTIQGQRAEFDERNNFLYFVLGMISLSHSVLGSFGATRPGPAGPVEPAPPPPPSEEEAASEPPIRPFLR